MMDDDDDNEEDHRIQSHQGMMSADKTNSLTSSSNQRRVRVKFAYLFDKDEHVPMTQTTIIKSEPCFQVIAKEDQLVKDFYQNQIKQHEDIQLMKQSTSFESDSLEEKSPLQSTKERSIRSKVNKTKPVPLPIKSILKKPKRREEQQQQRPKLTHSIRSRSSSSSTRLDFNEVQHLAEMSARENLPSSSLYCRSLFDQTINIFNPNYFHQYSTTSSRPLRFQHYIKPYRGDSPTFTTSNKSRSRSLPKSSERISRWDTFTNEHTPPLRKQHVSWSPARDRITRIPTREAERLSNQTNILPQNSPHILPVTIHNRSSRYLSSTPSKDSSVVKPLENENEVRSSRSNQQHDETMKKYDRLLERIRTTDEQLHLLSQSWMKNTRERIPVETNRRSNLKLNRTTRTNENQFSLSPMMIQICLIILIIINLLIVYFFNEINVWWSENIASEMIAERQNEHLWNT